MVGKKDIRGQRSEVGERKARGRRSEAGKRKTRGRNSESRPLTSDFGPLSLISTGVPKTYSPE
jgi:hypothetical protein